MMGSEQAERTTVPQVLLLVVRSECKKQLERVTYTHSCCKRTSVLLFCREQAENFDSCLF